MPWGAPTPAAGGGGSQPVTALLEVTGLNLRDATAHPLKWTHAYNNGYDYTTILALPAGLGITAAFDGTSETLTTTTAGTWALTLAVTVPGDATWNGTVIAESNLTAQTFLPALIGASNSVTVGGVFTYPSAATVAPSIVTNIQATANPLTIGTAELLIVRLG